MTGLDHLVLATPDLPGTTSWIEKSLGVRPSAGGQHRGRGTRNFLLSLGPGRYLEIIGADAQQPEPEAPRPFGIDTLSQATLEAWAARSADLEQAVAIAARHGYDLGRVQDRSRTTPDGSLLRWRNSAMPGSGISVIPFLIDWGDTVHPSSTSAMGASLVSFQALHPEPGKIRRLLDALGLDVEVEAASEPRLVAEIRGPAGTVKLS